MRMKKFINEPRRIVPELLEGLSLAFPEKIRLAGEGIVARAKAKSVDKVRIVTLGGSGHEPGLSGFVGEGMLDYSVAGEIFAAPGAPKVIEALRQACAGGAKALLVVLNHAGDVLSSNIAMQAAAREGLPVKMVLTHEDISSGPDLDDRRGLVGFLPVYKKQYGPGAHARGHLQRARSGRPARAGGLSSRLQGRRSRRRTRCHAGQVPGDRRANAKQYEDSCCRGSHRHSSLHRPRHLRSRRR